MRWRRFKGRIMTQRHAQCRQLIAQGTQFFFHAGDAFFLVRHLRIERADHFVLKCESRFEIVEAFRKIVRR